MWGSILASARVHGLAELTRHALKHLLVLEPYDLQVGAQTETELKEKKLQVEDALNATKVHGNWWQFSQCCIQLSHH